MVGKIVIGDKVAVIDDDIKGAVVGITHEEVSIRTTDDFIMKFPASDLVKIVVEQSEIQSKSFHSFSSTSKIDYNKKGKITQRIPKRNKGQVPPMEVDLHVEKLIKSKRGMDNYDILSLQVDTAKYKLEFAIKNRIPKIVFIHGVGEGVLKEELSFLFNRYDKVRFSDASYQKYGMGATEVTILQNTKY